MLPSEDTADSKEDSSGNKKKTSADKPVSLMPASHRHLSILKHAII